MLPKTPTNNNVSQYNEITKPDVQKENETGIKIQENNVYEFGTTMKIDLANVDHITQSMGDNSNYSLVIYEKNNGEIIYNTDNYFLQLTEFYFFLCQ